MDRLLAIALSFPSVVYTVLLGAALVYWVFVMVGAARVNLLGDGAADGALDGLGDGHADVGDVGHHGDVGDAGGHADAGDGGDGGDGDGGDGDAGDGHHGALAGMMAALKLRSAPATVVLSLVVLFAWLFSVLAMQSLPAMGLVAKAAVFAVSPILALFPTSIAVRPLARIFVTKTEVGRKDLVGKTCRIRTGTVTDRFGEAMLEDGGAGLVVRVRVHGGEELKRGDHAVIVDYDEERQEFTVARVDEDLG